MDELGDLLCKHVAAVLGPALDARPRATLVLPGGGTPQSFLPVLADCPIDWRRMYIIPSDERWVDPDHQDSNEAMIRACLSGRAAETATLVGLKSGHAEPEQAVTALEARLRQLQRPFDLTILGMGRDGHIASLFPGFDDAGHDALCQVVRECPPPVPRVTLTLEALASSRHIMLVYADTGKSLLMDSVLAGTGSTYDLPVSRLLRRTRSPVTLFEAGG